MKEIKDKLKQKTKKNKNLFLFLIGISIIGLISGSIFLTIINKSDQGLVKEYIEKFIVGIDQDKLNYLEALKNTILSNFAFLLLIFILGMTVIGNIINLFIYFTKSFILGFSISSFVLQYGFKGTIFSVIYIIPGLINLLLYTILLICAILFSIQLLEIILQKRKFPIKWYFKRYVFYFLFLVVTMVLNSFLEVYLVPTLIGKILFLVK